MTESKNNLAEEELNNSKGLKGSEWNGARWKLTWIDIGALSAGFVVAGSRWCTDAAAAATATAAAAAVIIIVTIVVIVGRGEMLLVPRPHILEPDLSHAFWEASQIGNTFQILTIWIGIEQEIGLQNVQLFFGKCRPYSFRFTPTATFRISFYSKSKQKNKQNQIKWIELAVQCVTAWYFDEEVTLKDKFNPLVSALN